MSQTAEIISPGFSVADAEDMLFKYEGEHLILHFSDWRENPVQVIFENTIGCRYQLGEYQICEGERFDSTHLIKNSQWLKRIQEQGETWEGTQWSHYKLNFNGVGVLEVVCTAIRKVGESVPE